MLYGLAHSEDLRKLYAQATLSDADVQTAIAILEDVGAKDFALEQERYFFDSSLAALDDAHPTDSGRETLMALINRLFKRSY